MVITYNTTQLVETLKSLLFLQRGSSWICRTMEGSFELKFYGNKERVQKELFKWLQIRRDISGTG